MPNARRAADPPAAPDRTTARGDASEAMNRRRRLRAVGPRGRRALALAVAFLALAPLASALSTGTAAAAPPNAPTLSGYYIVGNGSALVAVGSLGLLDVWNPAGANGTQVYSTAFYLVFFNLHPFNTTVAVALHESNGYRYTTSVVVPALSSISLQVSLSLVTTWLHATLYFAGVPYWSGPVAVPVSALQTYLPNVGGLDLFALVLVSLTLLGVFGTVVVARAATRRAVWAPRFSALVWGHVVLALIATLVFLDYQFVDSVFAGWSPLVYPLVVDPMVFLWALSLFNSGERVQVQQGTRTEEGGLGLYVTELTVGRVPDGRPNAGKLVWVDESWPGFWARYWGHFVLVETSGEERLKPWLAPVTHLMSPTSARRSRRKARRMAAAQFPTTANALTRFPVVHTKRKRFAYLAWGAADALPDVRFPYLSVHRPKSREVVVRGPDGTSHVETKTWVGLAWPHYVDQTQPSPLALETEHYEPAAAVWYHFADVRDLGRAYQKISRAFDALSQSVENVIQDRVNTKLRTRYALVGRATSGMSYEEAARAAGEVDALLDEKAKAEGGG